MPVTRRHWLERCAAVLAAGSVWPAAYSKTQGSDPAQAQLAATWQLGAGYQVGLLHSQATGLAVRAALDVPTRAHGLLQLADGHFLAVARRPGDWLVRWSAQGLALSWAWIESDRAFNGHVISSADGQQLFTTETDLGTGQGLIGVRHAATLEKIAEWPTHGRDPHELLLDDSGALIVANGGIATQAETGRRKVRTAPMDSSLVRLSTQDGALLGQWQLEDAELSLRHLAWSPGPAPRMLGIALQAEHTDPAIKLKAPVLALFDGKSLRVAHSPQGLEGYGGDIASAGRVFAVSCPRAGGVALYALDGSWQRFVPLEHACALAAGSAQDKVSAAPVWAGGQAEAMMLATTAGSPAASPAMTVPVRLDNHWLLSR